MPPGVAARRRRLPGHVLERLGHWPSGGLLQASGVVNLIVLHGS
ncbi:Uncharacterized protein PPKH_1704 [Pseudomonas putida]|nr:Uncharacterized protein PPKH_1704 [Pseudomonas putida]